MFVTSPLSADPSQAPIWRRPAWISLALLPLLLAWDFSGGDMKMAAIWGERDGFALRSNWWMEKIMHEGARTVGWLFLLTLFLSIWRPWGALRSLATADRASVFGSVLCALLSVTVIKGLSETSCPWDLQVFGGLAPYVSHWDFWQRDGGGGHCFPAGHASTGFAFMSAYFGLKQNNAPAAWVWLLVALLIGFELGISQQIRGAHFMSHTLWTAWLCWTVGWLSHLVFFKLQHRKK
jgi:membrane-associated PAP2 superfamily phosphatase